MHGYGPPGFGSGLTDNEVYNETHRMKRAKAAQHRLLKAGQEKADRKGIHKLMQSGSLIGKVVKFFYRLIWDVTYR